MLDEDFKIMMDRNVKKMEENETPKRVLEYKFKGEESLVDPGSDPGGIMSGGMFESF